MQKDLLEDLYDQHILIPATKWQRTGNLLLDTFFSILTFYIIFTPLLLYVPYISEVMTYENDGYMAMTVTGLFLIPAPFLIYYTLLEALNKGRTIGKMITGTYAVKKDGTPLTLPLAFLRTIIRMIPFEVISGIRDECWHDKWSNTTVVRK